MDRLEEIIEESRSIIKDNMEKKYMPMAKTIERFLSKERVPVEFEYSSDEPYKLSCYPDTNFLNVVNKIKEELKPELEQLTGSEVLFRSYIPKYMMILSYDNVALLQVTNMFYPYLNTKFRVDTYQDDSRFGIDGKIFYVHPKLTIDHLAMEKYDPMVDQNLMMEETLERWKKLGRMNAKQPSKMRERKGIKEYNMVKDKVVLCNHDFEHVSCICWERDIDDIIKTIDPDRKYVVTKNIIKSLHEIRRTSVTLSLNNRVVIKFWPSLEYELIPTINGACHPFVSTRYAIIDFLNYDILGIKNVAEWKLGAFDWQISNIKTLREKHIMPSIQKCKWIGTYYPISLYRKQLRIDKISEMIAKKNS